MLGLWSKFYLLKISIIALGFRIYHTEEIVSYMEEPFPEEVSDPTKEFLLIETSLQRENCFNTSQFISRCQECQRDQETKPYLCRFNEFRKIELNDFDQHEVSGFLDPFIDPTLEDIKLWTEPEPWLQSDRESTDYILSYIASDFCELSENEQDMSKRKKNVAWKRSVLQVREMCDVCETSVFNFHWTCKFCGTCVCFDCYNEREQKKSRLKPKTKQDKDQRDKYFWLKCNSSNSHKMMPTQMIVADALLKLNQNLHSVCDERNIRQKCGCSLNGGSCVKKASQNILLDCLSKSKQDLSSVMKKQRNIKRSKTIRRLSIIEYRDLNASVQHVYTSHQKILKIIEASESTECYKLFQNEWEKGKPVVVANITKRMSKTIWKPEYFSSKFGNEKHAMINCENGSTINRVAMKYFWDGFKSYANRLPMNSEKKVVLKLKDWPTSDDFADVMKEHFEDVMKAVPLAAYTKRDGKFNLARYLPAHFSRPDLGPKMYSAYSQMHPSKQGSTDLHLDISDAINILVQVSKPDDSHLSPDQYSRDAILKVLKASDADVYDKNQIHLNKLPGAIWHIFPAHQADDMRKVLFKVAKEEGRAMGVNDDPIHDQNWYIDEELRKRLQEHEITAYTIVQYEGDAVFIPAGAPHQVLNVLDCIKVALDFVAPENLTECLNLTEEFRRLSKHHQNREDKLQIKNILYHTIKNLVPVDT